MSFFIIHFGAEKLETYIAHSTTLLVGIQKLLLLNTSLIDLGRVEKFFMFGYVDCMYFYFGHTGTHFKLSFEWLETFIFKHTILLSFFSKNVTKFHMNSKMVQKYM